MTFLMFDINTVTSVDVLISVKLQFEYYMSRRVG